MVWRVPFLLLALVCAVSVVSGYQAPARPELPAKLTDQDFWKLSVEASEPNGFFRSDNLTSNELWFQRIVPDLLKQTRAGQVYLGVGPEQNFTYIAAVRPAMAVIFDVRRGNMLLQLMYKALFELSNDRADFVAMLFSKPRPQSLNKNASVAALFSALAAPAASEALYRQNLKAIQANLTETHHLPLSSDDLHGVEYVYQAFFSNGYAVRASPTYAELMTARDAAGVSRSYLASDESFQYVKRLQMKNLVVPVVGDFAGPKAIRVVGSYLKSHGGVVSTFYLSNVEQYLYQDRKWAAFCRNVTTLPINGSSTFIRSSSSGPFGYGSGPRFVMSLGSMAEEIKECVPQ